MSCQVRKLHGLPGPVHRLDVFFCLYPQCSDAGAALLHVLHRVFIRVESRELIRRGGHTLHRLTHGVMRVRVRVRVRVRGRAEKVVAREAVLETLRWSHEAGDAVDGRGTGQGGGQPRIQGEGVCHGTDAGVNLGRAVEGQHG